jgi:hypothetical protein
LSEIKRNKISHQAMKRHEGNLSKRSQSEMTTYHMILNMWPFGKVKTVKAEKWSVFARALGKGRSE